MKRRYAVVLGIALGLVGSILGFATVARTEPQDRPSDAQTGPRVPKDTGAGEYLIPVVGGVYPSKGEAVAANEQMIFGDVQGYYVAPLSQFGGLAERLGVTDGYALVSVFRTEEGAQEFVDMAASFGLPATVVPDRVESFGGVYVGLGQEENLEGTGPLSGPIPASLRAPGSAG